MRAHHERYVNDWYSDKVNFKERQTRAFDDLPLKKLFARQDQKQYLASVTPPSPPPYPLQFWFTRGTQMVVHRPPYTGRVCAPYQCLLLRSVGSYLCHFMLTCNIPMTHNHDAGQPGAACGAILRHRKVRGAADGRQVESS